MAKQKWLVKTYKHLGLNENQLYTIWFFLFIGLSILYSYCYFLLWGVANLLDHQPTGFHRLQQQPSQKIGGRFRDRPHR